MQFHRKTIRLQEFDYATPGAYFVTICLQDRKCLFGEIVDGKVVLTAPGLMIERSLIELPKVINQVKLDEFVVMPNHLHAIIWIEPVGAGFCARPERAMQIDSVGAGLRARPERAMQIDSAGAGLCARPERAMQIDSVGAGLCARPERAMQIDSVGAGLCARPEAPPNTRATSLFNIMERFKSLTTKRYIDGVRQDQWPPFDKQLWQRSYYEHVVRNDDELTRARSYIQTNPLRWELDKENPNRKSINGS